MSLKVKVLKKFREDIFARFDCRKFRKWTGHKQYFNLTKCALCEKYFKLFCKKCPFYKFRIDSKRGAGCILWIKKILPELLNEISLHPQCCIYIDKNKSIKLLKQFTKKLEKYIEWI